MTKDDIAELLVVARLLRDRDLANLARAAREVHTAHGAVEALSGEIEKRRNKLRTNPQLSEVRPGSFDGWLRFVREEQARLAAECERARHQEVAARARARRSFGRAAALETLATRNGSSPQSD